MPEKSKRRVQESSEFSKKLFHYTEKREEKKEEVLRELRERFEQRVQIEQRTIPILTQGIEARRDSEQSVFGEEKEKEKENVNVRREQQVASMEGLRASEPWLCPLSSELFSEVLGFISFLEKKRREGFFKPGSAEEQGIEEKLSQLRSWIGVAEQVLAAGGASRKVAQLQGVEREGQGLVVGASSFVDHLPLEEGGNGSTGFELLEATVACSGKVARVLLPLCPDYQHAVVQRRLFDSACAVRRFDSNDSDCVQESKQSEDGFRTRVCLEGGVGEEPLVVPFSEVHLHLEQAQTQLRRGYVFDKCLRRVEGAVENREIFRAYGCSVDLTSSRVVEVFPEDKVIIKRVGKVRGKELVNRRLRREFRVHRLVSQLPHSSVNKLLHYFEDEEDLYSVSASAGDTDLLDVLAEYVSKFNKGFAEPVVQRLFREAAEALVLTHNVGIAHRDISLENLVLNSNCQQQEAQRHGSALKTEATGARERVELIDWGHSAGTQEGGETCVYEGPLGKVRYMSPELVLGHEKGLKVYDAKKADVFAFGVCLFSVLTGQMPFEQVTDARGRVLQHSAEQLVHLLTKKAGRRKLSAPALDILNRTLAWNPEQRITMKEVVAHPFFQL